MVDVIDKYAALKRYFPSPFFKLRDGQGLAIVLDIMGQELNLASADVAEARQQFILATAAGLYLQTHGINVDVIKPSGYSMSDTTFRSLIRIITNTSKNVEHIFERLFYLFFGPSAIINGLADVYSYRANEIIVEIKPQALIIASQRGLLGTTYLHRSSSNNYDGAPITRWSTTVGATAHAGDSTITLASVPPGMPTSGIAEIELTTSDAYETKGFDRIGSVLTFYSPFSFDHHAGAPISGPINYDNYPSGYIYQTEILAHTFGLSSSGDTSIVIQLPPLDEPQLPAYGTLYVDIGATPLFESVSYSIGGGYVPGVTTGNVTATLGSPLVFSHQSGTTLAVPNLIRSSIKTTLNQTIAAGDTGLSYVSVVNGADFPSGYFGAIKINRSGKNAEVVPFLGRDIGDNTKLLIDPGYVFRYAHVPTEYVHLMALKTHIDDDGTDYPFWLNDTAGLQNQFLNILRRVKVVGCKLVFQLI